MSGMRMRVNRKSPKHVAMTEAGVIAGALIEGPGPEGSGEPRERDGREDDGDAGGPVEGAEDLKRTGDQPVDERRLLEVGDAVEAGGDPVAGGEHVARDLSLHRIHIVHQRWGRNHAAGVDQSGEEQDDQVVVRTLSHVRRAGSSGNLV